MDVTTVIVGIVCFAVAAVVFFVLGNQYRKNVAEKEIGSAEEEAKRIINAGIDRVVIRRTPSEYTVVHVEDWIREDDSLPPALG